MSKSGKPVRPAPSIATRAELDRHLAARPKPKMERQLTIGGWQDTEVRRNVNAMTENRIAHLETRLDRARGKTLRDHRLANLRGRAKTDFQRGR